MKSTNAITTILITLTFLLTTTVFAGGFEFEDENYINDIPFDTEAIYSRLAPEMAVFPMETEAYIDDIPFNTHSISAGYYYEKSLNTNYRLNDETNIADIPFNTQLVASQYNYNAAVQIAFHYDEEQYIEDIPFDTYALSLKNNCLNDSCYQ